MEIRHTPTPWKTTKSTADFYDITPAGDILPTIASVWDGEKKNAEANAAFIVRACNAHDELVLAAKDAAITIKLIMDCFPSAKASESHVFMRLMKALAKAEAN